MNFFPVFSIVSGSEKAAAAVAYDENSASFSFKNVDYPFQLKILVYRRPFTRSLYFLPELTLVVIVCKYPGLPRGNVAMVVRENLFLPKRCFVVWFIVIYIIAGT